MSEFAIGDHDIPQLAQSFASRGRVRIQGFLEAGCAESLAEHLQERQDWLQLIHSHEKVFELDRTIRATFDETRQAALDQAVFAQARCGFQYRYEAIRVPDDAAARSAVPDPLARYAEWLSAGTAREFLRVICGDQRIEFADAQATAYSSGDFLTAHDDAVATKRRRAAYVLGLTPHWRIEWGGLLVFHGSATEEHAALAPGFNTLDLFRVPQIHSVSLVSPAAAGRRYGITGWLRQGDRDA